MRLHRDKPTPAAPPPGPSRGPRPSRRCAWAAPAAWFALACSADAATIAHWRFDVVTAAADGRHLPASGPHGHTLLLGPGDWTVEAWLHLDPAALGEGVVLEIGSDPRRPDDLTTRLSVLPRDNAFVLSSLPPGPGLPP